MTLEDGEIDEARGTPAEMIMRSEAARARRGPDGTMPADEDDDGDREAPARPEDDERGEAEWADESPSNPFLDSLSWQQLLAFINGDTSNVCLHDGLTFEAVSNELEKLVQEMADEGDEFLLYIRHMASKVKKMPMVPVLAMIIDACDKILRVRRFNVSTSVDGQENTPVSAV